MSDKTSEVEKILEKLLSDVTPYKEYQPKGVKYHSSVAIDALSALIGQCIPEPRKIDGSKFRIQGYNEALDTTKENLRKRGFKI